MINAHVSDSAKIMCFSIIENLNYVNVMKSKTQPMDHSVNS